MSTSRKVVGMDIHFWHLYDADGISEDGLSLTIFITRGVNLQLRSLSPLGIVILEETNEHFDWFVAFKLDSGPHNTCAIAIQYCRWGYLDASQKEPHLSSV